MPVDWDATTREDEDTIAKNNSAGAASGTGQFYEIPNLPYAFNPPPHPSILHNTAMVNPGMTSVYDEKGNIYDPPKVIGPGAANLRLGRIVMWDKVFSYSAISGLRYGFRFLYNPSTVQGSQNVGTDFIPDPSSTIGFMLQNGLEVISLELLINRMPEIQGGAGNNYPTPIGNAEWEQLQERGTHYDVEYLYRIANGIHNTRSRTRTGDIGILLPNPCELHLGPFRSRGSIISLTVIDQMFSANMVPMLSTVQIQFNRYMSFTPTEEETSIFASTGVGAKTGTGVSGKGDNSAPGTGGTYGTYGPGEKVDPDVIYEIALEIWGTPAEATEVVKISYAESDWVIDAQNKEYAPILAVGLMQIRVGKGTDERGNYMDFDTRYEKYNTNFTKLTTDPYENLRVAYQLYKGSKWQPWASSQGGTKYNNCPWKGPK